MHYAHTDAIVAEIADDMDLSAAKATELVDQFVETGSFDALPFLSSDLLESYEWNEDDEAEWNDETDFEQA
jgi:hypothetical protein